VELQGIERDYGKDPAKRRIRALFRDFIEETFPANRRFGWMNVLSLVGSECHEFNEVYSHFDELKPSCLAVVERDKLSARLIKASLPEAEVFAGELSEYVKKTKRKFDVISLDFTSTMSQGIVNLLMTMRRRELLSDKAAILVAVSGKRENSHAKDAMRDLAELAILHDTPAQSVETALRGDSLPEEIVENNLAGVRNDAVSHGITCALLSGAERIYPEWVEKEGNAALKQRIAEESFRVYVSTRMKQNSGSLFEGIELEDVRRERGRVIRRMGLKMGVGGYTTNPDFEGFLEGVKNAELRPVEHTSEKDTPADPEKPFAYAVCLHREGDRDQLLVNRDKWKLWQEAFWQKIGSYMDGDGGTTKPEFVCWSLFKDALLKLFAKDLRGENGMYSVARGIAFQVPKWMPGLIFEYTFGGKAGAYWITKSDRYRYVSDTGCPMLVDMFRVRRTFRYDKMVTVSPEGFIIPAIPEKVLSEKDPKKAKRRLEDFFADFMEFVESLRGAMHVNASEGYPPRIEVTGEEVMHDCAECDRKDKELDLLKAQLREMKEIVRESKGSKKLVSKVFKVGEYERRKIVEMLMLRHTDEEIMKELNVGKMQIAGIKALSTRLGGLDKTARYFEDRQKGTA